MIAQWRQTAGTMRIDRDPLRKPPGGRVPASPGRSVYATTSVKMRRKAASTLFSEYGHARKDVINRRPGGNSIRGLTFDRWRAKNRRETGEKKEKRKKKIGTGPWAVASEGRPQSWRETRLIYVRKWPINRRVIDARARCQRVAEMRFFGLTLNHSFAAVHLVGRAPRKRRRRAE